MNVIVKLQFGVLYYDIAVQCINYYATGFFLLLNEETDYF